MKLLGTKVPRIKKTIIGKFCTKSYRNKVLGLKVLVMGILRIEGTMNESPRTEIMRNKSRRAKNTKDECPKP